MLSSPVAVRFDNVPAAGHQPGGGGNQTIVGPVEDSGGGVIRQPRSRGLVLCLVECLDALIPEDPSLLFQHDTESIPTNNEDPRRPVLGRTKLLISYLVSLPKSIF